MDAAAVSGSSTSQAVKITEELVRAQSFWKGALLILGSLGVLCGFIGLLLSFETLVGLTGASLSRLGSVLVAASFALMFLAAHSMDKIHGAGRAIRLELRRPPVSGIVRVH